MIMRDEWSAEVRAAFEVTQSNFDWVSQAFKAVCEKAVDVDDGTILGGTADFAWDKTCKNPDKRDKDRPRIPHTREELIGKAGSSLGRAMAGMGINHKTHLVLVEACETTGEKSQDWDPFEMTKQEKMQILRACVVEGGLHRYHIGGIINNRMISSRGFFTDVNLSTSAFLRAVAEKLNANIDLFVTEAYNIVGEARTKATV